MQPEIGLRPDPTSADLLLHDGLMSPKLTKRFGEMVAKPSLQLDEGSSITRQSSLFQKASDAKILDASLRISKHHLPDALLAELFDTDALLGDLLRRFEISVKLTRRTIYHSQDPSGHIRWGRRHVMCSSDAKVVLCEVDELLLCAARLDELLLGRSSQP